MAALREQVELLRFTGTGATPARARVPQGLPGAARVALDRQHAEAVAEGKQADELLRGGDSHAAALAYRSVDAALEAIVGSSDPEPVWLWDLSVVKGRIAQLLRAEGDLDQALQTLRAVLGLREQAFRLTGDNPNWRHGVSDTQVELGDLHRDRGEWAEAQEAFRVALRIREPMAALKPPQADWLRSLAVVLWKLAEMSRLTGDAAGEGAYLARCHGVLDGMRGSGLEMDGRARHILWLLDEARGRSNG
jgi:tetratricopeptide (TPR) repeat protein